ncbi:MAG: hypothetical protein IT324_16785 [Anaerolineae bacterium]|nr:hypothetical protein [Anaerolineae bacterium]
MSEKRASDVVRERALGAMLTDAFFTWPSAVNIAFSLIMFFLVPHLFVWWQPWFWIVFGVVAEAIYLVATLTDPVANQQAVSRMLMEKFDPGDIRNQLARQRLQKALEYKKNIDAFVARQSGALKVSLSQTANEINDWIELIYRLARSIDTFEANSIIDRDRRAVPTELEALKRRLNVETDPDVRRELQEACEIRQRLLDNLNSIASSAKRTEIKMDNTLAQLSTVYAQMQLLDARELDSGRAQRLREEIQEEIASLSDTISAMDDVYAYKGYKNAVQNLDAETAAGDTSASNAARSARRSSRNG